MTDPAETWLPLQEAAARYGLDYFQLHKWYRCGHIRGRKVQGQVEIDQSALADFLPPPGWDWLAASSRHYGLSYNILYDLIRRGELPARKRGGRWQVARAALEQILAERAVPTGWLTAKEAGQRLGVTAQEVLRRIRVGQLQARAHGPQFLVAAAEVQELVIPPGWLTPRQLAEKAQVCPGAVYAWIAKGWVQARKVHGRWIVAARLPERKRPGRPGEQDAT